MLTTAQLHWAKVNSLRTMRLIMRTFQECVEKLRLSLSCGSVKMAEGLKALMKSQQGQVRFKHSYLQHATNSHSYNLQASSFTFAKVFGIERQAVSRQRLQQQLVAGPPAGLWDGGSHTLHGCNALEERRLAAETDKLVELRQDAVALNLLLLRQL